MRDFFWHGYFLCSLVKKNFFTVVSLHKLGLVLLWLFIQNFEHVVVLVSIDFPSNSKGDAFFHCTAFDYFPVNWDGFHNYLKNVLWEHILKFSTSRLLLNLVNGFQLEVMYIIINIRSSLFHLNGYQMLLLLP